MRSYRYTSQIFLLVLFLFSNSSFAQHGPATPVPSPTATPTRVPTLAPLAVNCPDIGALKVSVARMLEEEKISAGEAASRNNILDRMGQECSEYLRSGSGGYGSIQEIFNDSEKREAVPSKLQAMTEEWKRRFDSAQRSGTMVDTSAMTDVVPEHPLWMGDDVFSIVARVLDDQLDMFLDFTELMGCLDASIDGLCVHWECFTFVCVPIPDILRSYRFPVAVVQGVQDRGMDGYTVGFLAEQQVESGFPFINNKDTILTDARRIQDLVHVGMNTLKDQPGLMPNAGNPVKGQFTPSAITSVQNSLEGIVASANLDERDARAKNPQGDGFTRMEYHVNRTALEQVFQNVWYTVPVGGQILAAVGGPCHNRLRFNPFAGFWSEGGAFPWVSATLSRFLYVTPPFVSNMTAFPVQIAQKAAMPVACSQYNMAQGDDRLKSPSGLLYPLIPFSNDNGLTKECGTGNQQHTLGVLNSTNQLDLRSSSEQTMLRGLKAVNVGRSLDMTRMVRRTFYGFDDDHEHDEDRFWVMHDKDHRDEWDGCQRFSSKTLKYARTWTLKKRDHSLNEFDPDEHDESDGAWNAGYQWRKFRCCEGDIVTQWSGKDGKKTQ